MYRDPFRAGNSPKIPDGKCVQSLGVKKNVTLPIDFVAEQNQIDMLFYPGLNKCLFVRGTKLDNTPVDAGQVKGFVTPITRHEIAGVPATLVPNENSSSIQRQDHEVAKWRLVSGGMKVQSLTDCDDDGAWFECFRFSPQYGQQNFKIQADAASDTIWLQPQGIMCGNFTLDSLSEKGNYFAGKLNQLGRYPMKFNEVNSSHDFITLGDGVYQGPDHPVELSDMNMDCIYLRIYGKPAPTAPGTSCCGGTKLLVNIVMNYELVLAEENVMHKLQTRGTIRNQAYYDYRGNYFPYYSGGGNMVAKKKAGLKKKTTTTRKRRAAGTPGRRPARRSAVVT